jgi:hypothetical protein
MLDDSPRPDSSGRSRCRVDNDSGPTAHALVLAGAEASGKGRVGL